MVREIFDDFPEYSTVKEIVLGGAERGGDKRQFVFEDEDGNVHERSFRQVYEEECKLGAYIRSLGIKEKMKVAVLSENSYEWNVVFYAVAVNGCVIVPMDTHLAAEEVAGELADCFCDAIFYSEANAEKIEVLKAHKGTTIKWYLPMSDFEKYKAEGEKVSREVFNEYLNAPVNAEDLATIVYTSGTTGRTKGVMLSHKNICCNCNATLRAVPGEHAIGFLPLNHTYAWSSGLFGSLIRTEWGYINTNIRHIYNDIKKYQPIEFAAVPLVVEMIYSSIISNAKRKGNYDKLMKGIETSRNFMLSGFDCRRDMFSEIHEKLGGQLQYIFCGGAYLSPEIEEFMHDIGIQIITGYGLTECSPCVTCSRRYDYKIGSVGLPLDCNEIKIKDPDEDGIGEILVKGDNVMMGYFNDPESTAAVFDEGGWLKTGDYGYIDFEGYLFFTGRKKNLIVLSNGKNVSPEEIEGKISCLEYVKEAICYAEDGRIIAECFLDEEKYEDARELIKDGIAEVNKTLATYKQVAHVRIRDEEFPKTASLKIIRKGLGKKAN